MSPNPFDLSGRVAIVTGTSRGLGQTFGRALAKAGADLVITSRDAASLKPFQEEIEALGRKALSLALDVRTQDSIQAMVAAAVAHYGKIDILVNNAGIAPENLIENVTENDFDDTLAVNLKGTFFVSQAAGELMIQQKFGRIINLSSQAGFIALPTESVYCMTKAGIAHLTKCFAVEWAKYNINVNAVAPTFIHTPGTEEYLAIEKNKEHVLSKIMLGKIGEPKDVANAVLFLASPASSYMTGAALNIDGGWTAW